MPVRKAGAPDVLALLRQDKYRYLDPEDLPTRQEQRLIDGNIDGERDEEFGQAELAQWLQEREQMAPEAAVSVYEQAVAQKMIALAKSYPQLGQQELLRLAIDAS